MMVDVKIQEARKAMAAEGITLKNKSVLDSSAKGKLKEYIQKDWGIMV